jgi:hypothetical protein
MKHQVYSRTGRLNGLPVPDIAPDLVDTHVRKFWVIASGQTANCIAPGNQTFDDGAAEKPAAAGD